MRTSILMFLAVFLFACENGDQASSDRIQSALQETALQDGVNQVGLPNIKNWRELKIVKDIYELRDQENVTTYTYLFSEMTGKLIFFCNSIGYGVPYATQYSNPQKVIDKCEGRSSYCPELIAQAEPNGLFSPQSATSTWVMCADAKGNVRTVYVEPMIIVSPFPLQNVAEIARAE